MPPPEIPRPWRLAFGADDELPTLVHLLLGMNAHINYDLPQAMLAVIDEDDFTDPVLLDRRRRDHERIDAILASRVAAEDHAIGGARSVLDKILTGQPVEFAADAPRGPREGVAERGPVARRPAQRGRDLRGPVAELEVLAAAKIADLLRPGQVLLRLAATGFGVVLPPP